MLFHAGGDIHFLFDEEIHNRGRGWRPDNPGMLQFPGEEKVVGASFAHDDPMLRAVHFLVGSNFRALPNQVAPFDQQIGSGKRDSLSTDRIDGKKADVRLFPGDRLYGFAGGIKQDELDFDAKPFREIIGKIDGYPDRRAASRIPPGKNRIAEVDRCAQSAGRCEFPDNVRWNLQDVGSPIR